MSERTLVSAVGACNNLPGDMVEVGVADGVSAAIIRQAMHPEKFLWLYDTFTGMPPEAISPGEEHLAGIGSRLSEENLARLRGMHRTRVVKGIFPASAVLGGAPKEVAFLHLDVDTELSTSAGIRYFASKLVPGGMILLHDYGNELTPGVRRAADFFLHFFGKAVRPLQPFELSRPDTIYGLIRRKTMEEYRNEPGGVTGSRAPGPVPVTPQTKEGT